jgi:hypothetical protein
MRGNHRERRHPAVQALQRKQCRPKRRTLKLLIDLQFKYTDK